MLDLARLIASGLFAAITVVTGIATILGCSGFPKGTPDHAWRWTWVPPAESAAEVAAQCRTSGRSASGPPVPHGPDERCHVNTTHGAAHVVVSFADDGSQSLIDVDGTVFPVVPYDESGQGRRSVVLPVAYFEARRESGVRLRGMAPWPIVIPGHYVDGFLRFLNERHRGAPLDGDDTDRPESPHAVAAAPCGV